MPNAELVVLEGGHTINNLNPSEFNLAMLEFLERQDRIEAVGLYIDPC